MDDETGAPVGNALKYAMSGGFLAVAFGVLAAAPAQAKPIAVDADGNQAPAKPSPNVVEAAKLVPGGGFLKIADSAKKLADSARSNNDKKEDKQKDGNSPPDQADEGKPQREKKSQERGDETGSHDEKDKSPGREEPAGQPAVAAAKTGEQANRAKPDDGGVGAMLQPLLQATPGPEVEQDPLLTMPQPKVDRSAAARDVAARNAAATRSKAYEYAAHRNEGATGSVTAWETTNRFADEYNAEATGWERIRDAGVEPSSAPPKVNYTVPVNAQTAVPLSAPATVEVSKWENLPGESGGVPVGVDSAGRRVALSKERLSPELQALLEEGGTSTWSPTEDGRILTVFTPETQLDRNRRDLKRQWSEAGSSPLDAAQAAAGTAALISDVASFGAGNSYGTGADCLGSRENCDGFALEGGAAALTFVPGGRLPGAVKGAVAAAGAAAKGGRALGQVADATNLISRANAARQGAAGVTEGARAPVAAGARAVPGPGITSAPSAFAGVEEVAATAAKGLPAGGADVLPRAVPGGAGPAGRTLRGGGMGGRAGSSGPARSGSGPAYGKAAPLVAGVAGTGVIAEVMGDRRGDAQPSPEPGDAPPSRGPAEPRTPPLPDRYPAPGQGGRRAEPDPGAGRGLDPRLVPWAVPSGPRGPGDPVPDNWGRPDPRFTPLGVPTEPVAPGSPVPGDWDLPDPRLTPWGVPTEPAWPGLPAPVVRSESKDLATEEAIARPAPVPMPALLGPSITDIPRARFASPVWSHGAPEPAGGGLPEIDPERGAYLAENQAQNTKTRRNRGRAAEAVPVLWQILPELQKRADDTEVQYANGPGFTAGQLANQARILAEAEALIPLRRAETARVKAGNGDPERLQSLEDEEERLYKELWSIRMANAGTQKHLIFEESVMRDAAEILGEYADEYRFRVEVPFNINGEAVPGGSAGKEVRKTIPDLVLERRAPDGTWYRVQDFDLKTGKKGIASGWDFRNQRNARSLFKVITLRPSAK
ncbi:hypothetical protein AB0M80_35500 [Amycolatopsis sp. NPDC051045]|uniref:hypothetical protein n=1 Tax=Amycolatopsis sp. NPDC051045 TaxID=3156922 RepID=UPI00343D05C2